MSSSNLSDMPLPRPRWLSFNIKGVSHEENRREYEGTGLSMTVGPLVFQLVIARRIPHPAGSRITRNI